MLDLVIFPFYSFKRSRLTCFALCSLGFGFQRSSLMGIREAPGQVYAMPKQRREATSPTNLPTAPFVGCSSDDCVSPQICWSIFCVVPINTSKKGEVAFSWLFSLPMWRRMYETLPTPTDRASNTTTITFLSHGKFPVIFATSYLMIRCQNR